MENKTGGAKCYAEDYIRERRIKSNEGRGLLFSRGEIRAKV